MALVPCRECGQQVSTEAAACPKCGAKPKQPIGRLPVIAGLILGGYVLTSILPSTPATPITTTPDPAQPAPARVKERTLSDDRFQATARVLALIKTSMRDPDSLKWDQILSNDDGTVVCVTYRGRNGFGGMNFEHVAYVKGAISTTSKAWNRYCAKQSLHDMKYAAFALK